MIVIALLSVAYFGIVLGLIFKFGWYGLALSYGAGLALAYFQASLNDEKPDKSWLFIAPVGFFLAGGIAGSFILIPLSILGIVDTPSSYVSDDEYFSRR